MAEDNVFGGKDLEAALEQAAAATGIPEADLHYEIVEQGRRGVFGLGAKSVTIRVMPPLEDPSGGAEEIPARDEAKQSATPAVSLDTDAAEAMLRRIIELMQFDLEVKSAPPSTPEGGRTLELDGRDRKLLHERNGELLHALQFVMSRMARRNWPEAEKVRLIVDGQGRDRDGELISLTRDVAQQVARTGRTKKLRPMNAYERRLVHLTVREFAGLSSSSDGSGALKRVRISKVHNTM